VVVVGFFISIFILYFTILHDTFIIVQLRGIYYNYFYMEFQITIVAVWPHFIFESRCPFCSPKDEKNTPDSLVSPRRHNFNLILEIDI
jgi:hypothetical protein